MVIIATFGTAGNEPFSPMEHFFVALSIVAALGAVVLNVVNAGIFVGISVTFIQIPLAFLLGFFFLFMPRSRR